MNKDPYVYDDTNVLKNLANIKGQNKLDDYQTTMVNLDKYECNYHSSKKEDSISDLLSNTFIERIDIIAVRHFLKSISLQEKLVSLTKAYFFI